MSCEERIEEEMKDDDDALVIFSSSSVFLLFAVYFYTLFVPEAESDVCLPSFRLTSTLLKSWWWPHLCKVKLRGCFCRSVAFPFPLETEKVWILPNISNFFFSTKHVPCYNFCYFLSEGNEKGEQKKQVILLFLDIFVYIPLKSWNRRSREKSCSDLSRKEEETIRFLFRSVQDEQESFTPAALDPLSFPATNVLDCMIYGGVIFEEREKEGAVMSSDFVSWQTETREQWRETDRRIGKKYTQNGPRCDYRFLSRVDSRM